MTIGSVNFSNPSLYPTTTSAPASQPTAGPALPQESVTLGQSQAEQPSLATLSAASQGSVQGVDSAAVAESGSGLGKAVAGAAVLRVLVVPVAVLAARLPIAARAVLRTTAVRALPRPQLRRLLPRPHHVLDCLSPSLYLSKGR